MYALGPVVPSGTVLALYMTPKQELTAKMPDGFPLVMLNAKLSRQFCKLLPKLLHVDPLAADTARSGSDASIALGPPAASIASVPGGAFSSICLVYDAAANAGA